LRHGNWGPGAKCQEAEKQVGYQDWKLAPITLNERKQME
jgi:hypothetical protein